MTDLREELFLEKYMGKMDKERQIIFRKKQK